VNDLERQLRHALRPKPAPPGFAVRVLERTVRTRRRAAFWIPAAAAAGLLITGGIVHQRDVARGEEAKRQLLTALEITAEKIHFAESKVRRLEALEQRQ